MSYPWGTNLWDHKEPIGLSYSSNELWDYCPRKFEFQKFYPRTEKDEDIHSLVGRAMHHGFQTWLKEGCTTEAQEKAFFELVVQYPIELESDPEAKKSLEVCYATLENIFDKGGLFLEYELATVKCLDGTERPAIEVEFEIWIDGIYCNGRPFVYRGLIDAILFNKFTGEYLVIDLKTTGWKNQHLVGKYRYNGQCIGYGIVLQAILQNDVLNFSVAYVHALLDIQEPDCKILKFDKTEDDIRDWATNLYLRCRAIKDAWSRNYFPRTEGGCVSFNKVCQFFEICNIRDRDALTRFIESTMVQGNPPKYNPWVRLVLPLGDEK